MNEQDISKLAREYANLRAFDGGFFPREDEIAEDYEVCLRLLLRDHCIVKKEKIREEYKDYKASYDRNKGDDDYFEGYWEGRVDTCEDLFGTDLFKERSAE